MSIIIGFTLIMRIVATLVLWIFWACFCLDPYLIRWVTNRPISKDMWMKFPLVFMAAAAGVFIIWMGMWAGYSLPDMSS